MSLKDRVPKISQGDFKELFAKFPMNKGEITRYLLKLHETDMELSPKFFEYLKMHSQLDVMNEAVQTKNKTASFFALANDCKKENDDV